jgi:glycosyltransferase involved in cell wall biosynthesis
MNQERFVIAVPFRTDYYCNYARLLEEMGVMRSCLTWTRRGFSEVPAEKNDKIPALGLLAYAAARTLPPYPAEAFRFGLHPFFDHWAVKRMRPGDHVLSSYGYANACFKRARQNGGLTFLDGGNSHPANFWEILTEEHARWDCPYPPISHGQYKRSLEMMEDVSHVLSPSNFVSESFLSRGFREEQILRVFYSVDLTNFYPSGEDRPKDRPFTIVNTGGLSLRKGTPYMLEAFRLIQKRIPNVRFLLTDSLTDSIKPIIARYSDLPIDWAPYLNERELGTRLRSADLFVLPSLEEGLVRTALQAMATGIPCILTKNTGANDYIQEGVNGSIVPIRDIDSIVDSACMWWEKISEGYRVDVGDFSEKLSYERLKRLLPDLLGKIIQAEVR